METYIAGAKDFFTFLAERGIAKISQAGRDEVKEYQNFLFYLRRGDKGLSPVTQSLRLCAVKCLFKFLVKENYLVYDPSADIELPKTRKRLPRDILSTREISRLLSAPDSHTPMGIRDRAILELFYSTGIRNTELRNLKMAEVDMRRGEIRITSGKGGKSRVVPIGEVAAYYLSLYLERSRPQLVKESDEERLFVSVRGRRLFRKDLTSLVHKYAIKAGIKKNITCHTLRHTCATHMLKGRADLRYIQELLGHGDLSTTQIYTRVELSDLKRVHAQCHPRNRL
jgi:integrase/recombinase XerD